MAMSFPGFHLEDKANAMKWFFLIFPHYSLSSSLNNLNTINTMDRVCQQKCEQLLICDRELLCKIIKQCCGKIIKHILTENSNIFFIYLECFPFMYICSSQIFRLGRARNRSKYRLYDSNWIIFLYAPFDNRISSICWFNLFCA